MEIRFDGKAALVTGASRGIGKAIALRLAKSGADVAINFNSNQEKAEEVCREIEGMGQKSIALQADMSDSGQVDRMIREALKRFQGRLDILVNNAGVYPIKEAVATTDEDWDRVVNLNLRGAFYASREAARRMIERGAGGRIIGIASGAGHGGRPGQASYCASKAGLILLCKTLAIELAPHGITVNTVSVGYVDVGQFDSALLEGTKKDILRRILLRRPGRPEDIAGMVAFLASEEAGWITGADFRVDGGESAGRVPDSV